MQQPGLTHLSPLVPLTPPHSPPARQRIAPLATPPPPCPTLPTPPAHLPVLVLRQVQAQQAVPLLDGQLRGGAAGAVRQRQHLLRAALRAGKRVHGSQAGGQGCSSGAPAAAGGSGCCKSVAGPDRGLHGSRGNRAAPPSPPQRHPAPPPTCSSTVHASVWPRIAAQCSGVQPSLSGRLHRDASTSSRRIVSACSRGAAAQLRLPGWQRGIGTGALVHAGIQAPSPPSQPSAPCPTCKPLVGGPVQRRAAVVVQRVDLGAPLEGQMVQDGGLAVLRRHVAHRVAAAVRARAHGRQTRERAGEAEQSAAKDAARAMRPRRQPGAALQHGSCPNAGRRRRQDSRRSVRTASPARPGRPPPAAASPWRRCRRAPQTSAAPSGPCRLPRSRRSPCPAGRSAPPRGCSARPTAARRSPARRGGAARRAPPLPAPAASQSRQRRRSSTLKAQACGRGRGAARRSVGAAAASGGGGSQGPRSGAAVRAGLLAREAAIMATQGLGRGGIPGPMQRLCSPVSIGSCAMAAGRGLPGPLGFKLRACRLPLLLRSSEEKRLSPMDFQSAATNCSRPGGATSPPPACLQESPFARSKHEWLQSDAI